MQVTCLKLASGIDLIARATHHDNGNLELNSVLQIQAYPSQHGMAVSLLPFVMFADPAFNNKTLTFRREDYLFTYPPKADLEAAYVEQTSGIVLSRPSGAPTPVKG